jgi:hypothetical protein
METRYLDSRDRVRHGKTREKQIAEALTRQGLPLADATDREDKEMKIDRWLVRDGRRTAVQIKYRETGDDLLVEVYDTWNGWDDPFNKPGRDMIGAARLYAVLRQDRKTVVLVPTAVLKAIVVDMVNAVALFGWTVDKGPACKTLRYSKSGGRCELKVQRDPRDGRTKMVAYIPAGVLAFEQQSETYTVKLPKEWQS